MAGHVMIYNNKHLCYANTIDWEDILSGEGTGYHVVFDTDSTNSRCKYDMQWCTQYVYMNASM